MNLKYVSICLLIYMHYQINRCSSERITYISTEHPKVYWYDPNLFKNATLLSKRFSRQDPRYYVELYIDTLFTMTNAIKVDIYFYQFLTNRYRRSFVEMHYGVCDLMHYDVVFGHAIRNALGGRDCPLPPGIYDMKNMTIPFVPKNFPFNKGRIYLNMSLTEGGSTTLIAWGSIDMEVKVAKINIQQQNKLN